MSAYMIARINVTDWETYQKYTPHTPRVISEFGGKFIARSASVEMLEGEKETRRVVVIEFPDVATARAWYESDDYQALKGIRENAGEGQFIIVDGFSDEAWLQAVAASKEVA